MKQLRAHGAIVGFGEVAQKAHAPAWAAQDWASIDALADSSEERLAEGKRLFPNARCYRAFEELLARETGLDFVDLATPPALHARQALAALERGLHVLCEKPLVFDPSELDSLMIAAAAGETAVYCVNNWKFAPLLKKAIELVAAGTIGRVRHVELHTLRSKPAVNVGQSWRTDPRLAGGGILMDHGWHNLYLVRAFIQEPLLRAQSALKFGADSPVETEATCLLEFANATAQIHLTWHSPERRNWGVVYGDQGALELRDDHILGAPGGAIRFPEKISQGSAHPEWFADMLGAFREEINRELAAPDFSEARFCADTLAKLRQKEPAAAVPA